MRTSVETPTLIIEIRYDAPMFPGDNLYLEIPKNSNPDHMPDLGRELAEKQALVLRDYGAESLGAGGYSRGFVVGVNVRIRIGSGRDGWK
jgi:hypothetical protein